MSKEETQFKKGHEGGPGRPTMSKEEKELSRLTRTKFNNICRKYLDMPKADLEIIYKDTITEVLDLMVISVMLKAIDDGDQKRINWFLEQLFGKLSDNVTVTTNVVSHASIMQQIHDQKNGITREDGESVNKKSD